MNKDFQAGSGCAILQKQLGLHAALYAGALNLEKGLAIKLIEDRPNQQYIGTIYNPKKKWAECYSFKMPPFGDRSKQVVTVKGLGNVIFNRGKTADQRTCIRMQVLEMTKQLPM